MCRFIETVIGFRPDQMPLPQYSIPILYRHGHCRRKSTEKGKPRTKSRWLVASTGDILNKLHQSINHHFWKRQTRNIIQKQIVMQSERACHAGEYAAHWHVSGV
jgi:hypothetical protein